MSKLLGLNSPRRCPSGHVCEGLSKDLTESGALSCLWAAAPHNSRTEILSITRDNIFINILSTRKKKLPNFSEAYLRAHNSTTNSIPEHSGLMLMLIKRYLRKSFLIWVIWFFWTFLDFIQLFFWDTQIYFYPKKELNLSHPLTNLLKEREREKEKERERKKEKKRERSHTQNHNGILIK